MASLVEYIIISPQTPYVELPSKLTNQMPTSDRAQKSVSPKRAGCDKNNAGGARYSKGHTFIFSVRSERQPEPRQRLALYRVALLLI